MKKNKLLSLLALSVLTGTMLSFTYASNDDYEEEHYDKYEHREDYKHEKEYKEHEYKNRYDEKYIAPASLPASIQDYVRNNYSATIIKAERKYYGYEVKLSNGMELKFDNNGKLMYSENYEYKNRYTQPTTNQPTITNTQPTTTKKQYKYLTTSVQEKLDNIIKVKLFDKIANLSTEQKQLTLNKLNEKIDALLLKIKSKGTLTSQDKLKIEVLEYLKAKVNDYLTNLLDPTTDIINSLFGN